MLIWWSEISLFRKRDHWEIIMSFVVQPVMRFSTCFLFFIWWSQIMCYLFYLSCVDVTFSLNTSHNETLMLCVCFISLLNKHVSHQVIGTRLESAHKKWVFIRFISDIFNFIENHQIRYSNKIEYSFSCKLELTRVTN